jgi:hypothetical protein
LYLELKFDFKKMGKTNDKDCSLTQRFKANEEYFSNFIDLIPSRIYLNVEDRKQWFNQLLNKNSDKEPTAESDEDIGEQV